MEPIGSTMKTRLEHPTTDTFKNTSENFEEEHGSVRKESAPAPTKSHPLNNPEQDTFRWINIGKENEVVSNEPQDFSFWLDKFIDGPSKPSPVVI